MEFLNAKEQVIDLQLTSYGRYLLSIGKFKPSVYAFFDDDILYDRRFAQSGSTEKTKEPQNEIEGRIQEGTARLPAQTLYRPSEIGVFSINPNLPSNLMPGVLADKTIKVNLTQTPEQSYIFAEPIGNSAYNSKNMAAWDIGFYKAPLSGSSVVWTGSNGDIPTTFIPQLSCSIKYNIETYDTQLEIDEPGDDWKDVKSFEKLSAPQETTYGTNTPIVFENGTYIIYKDDFALLKIEEANTEFLKENFEMEMFEIKKTESTKKDKEGNTVKAYSETLERLYFEGDNVPETERIDYYFDIDIDFEINEEEYCSLSKPEEKIKNIYVDRVFNCESKKEILHSLNIYGTGENQPPEEPC